MNYRDRVALRSALQARHEHDRPVVSAWLAIIAWCAVWGALGIIWIMGG